MSTTGTATAVMTRPETGLGPYATHAPTHAPMHRGLTGPGLPAGSALPTFRALRRDGLRTVADSIGDPDRVAAGLRERPVTGGLFGPVGLETGSLLPDGGSGGISPTYFRPDRHDHPGLMDARPLAPSLEALVRFAAVTEELAGLRGQFASYAGRYGSEAVAEASRQLLAVFEVGADGEVPPFWKAAALIRPLSLIAGPGTRSGLTLDLPARLLEREFGPGRVARFEDVDFPVTLTHEPTRRFLRETGLPEDGTLFQLDTDVPLPTLAEHHADEDRPHLAPTGLPVAADRLIRLGDLVTVTSLVVDGSTGTVWRWSEREATLHPLNTDVSTLAFTLWLLHRDKRIGFHDEAGGVL
ncbi:SUKH-4 family immunity protein [Streptomyces sp. NPDC021356]|uniref:SUKH-4 family immunity protein n=1 Tax=Streptomyces sp. NPDC021356 TaxID=3154900 RepID=UPI0033D32FBF